MAAIERTGNQLIGLPVAAGENLEAGTMVAINSEGYAVTAIKQESLTMAGIVQRLADNRLGANGEINVEVKRGAFEVANDGTVKSTDVLKTAYISDASTVTMTAAGSSIVGKILQVTVDGVTVEIL